MIESVRTLAPTVAGGSGDRSVLVVEDDAVIRRLIADVLAGEGYTVATVGDGASALAWLTVEHAVDLIFLDMRMPVMDGWAFADAYRATAGRRARVIALTAAADAARCASEIGADGVLSKPFDLDALVAIVQAHLGAPQRREPVRRLPGGTITARLPGAQCASAT